jgi:hypothetical protein
LADRAPARSIRHGERHRQTGLMPLIKSPRTQNARVPDRFQCQGTF